MYWKRYVDETWLPKTFLTKMSVVEKALYVGCLILTLARQRVEHVEVASQSSATNVNHLYCDIFVFEKQQIFELLNPCSVD